MAGFDDGFGNFPFKHPSPALPDELVVFQPDDNDDGSAYYNTHHVRRVILSQFVCWVSLTQ